MRGRTRRLMLNAGLLAGAGILLLSGCDAPKQPIGPDPVPHSADLARQATMHSGEGGVTARASGGGHFERVLFGEVARFQFAFTALQRNLSGDADGRFHFSSAVGGLAVEFHGRVTCFITDPATRRAWVGGVITKNDSEHPNWMGEIHQAGRDSWFRVVDYGEGSAASQPDRSSIMFFEGTAGFQTARDFCESGFWLPDDVFTSPLLHGNIQVRD